MLRIRESTLLILLILTILTLTIVLTQHSQNETKQQELTQQEQTLENQQYKNNERIRNHTLNYFFTMEPKANIHLPNPIQSNMGALFQKTNKTFDWIIIKEGNDTVYYKDFSLGEKNLILISDHEKTILGMIYYFGRSLFGNLPEEIQGTIKIYDCPNYNTTLAVLNTTDKDNILLLGIESVYNPTGDITSQIIITTQPISREYNLTKLFDILKQMECEVRS